MQKYIDLLASIKLAFPTSTDVVLNVFLSKENISTINEEFISGAKNKVILPPSAEEIGKIKITEYQHVYGTIKLIPDNL